MVFELKERDAAGRSCLFQTKHGRVTSPNLLPVINPNKMLITPREMRQLFGTEIVITNSYIIYKDPALKSKALDEGVHSLINFDGPVMTDSGAFQSYVYGDISIDPVEIVTFQQDIGSDVGTILDVFGTPDQTKTKAKHGVLETIQRAKQSIAVKKDMMLACTVQGGIYPDLREFCAQELSAIATDFFPIGGVVPLMENQQYSDVIRCILASKKGLDPSKPVHLFGAGHPLIFPIAVALGCDFFDSSAYIKYAMDGRMIVPWGTHKLDELRELPCSCPICSLYSASDIKALKKDEATIEIAKHNLYVSFAEIRKIRSAIAEGTLWELVERRAASNPYLLASLRELQTDDTKQWLTTFESLSKKRAVFYTGTHTIHRPLLYRSHQRLLTRYTPKFATTVVLPEGNKPYSRYYSMEIKALRAQGNVNIVVASDLGPVPIELDEMYPFAQSVVPEHIDSETAEEAQRVLAAFTNKKTIHRWNDNTTLNKIPPSKGTQVPLDHLRIAAVADMQFGKGAGEALFDGALKIVKSKKTGKIRNIYTEDEHVVSMRAEDGMFTLRIAGGKRLHTRMKHPQLRVVVDDDAVPFIQEGKSVFAKFVSACDPELIPWDECLIVDKNDRLLAVGRTVLNPKEMQSFEYGMAVKTRERL